MPFAPKLSDAREVRLFRNGRNQAVRIPVEFEMRGKSALIHREGDRLVIEPIRKKGILALLATWKPLDDDFPDVDAGLLPLRDIDL